MTKQQKQGLGLLGSFILPVIGGVVFTSCPTNSSRPPTTCECPNGTNHADGPCKCRAEDCTCTNNPISPCGCTDKNHLGINEHCNCEADVCFCELKTYGNFKNKAGKTIPIYREGTIAESDMETATNSIIAEFGKLTDKQKDTLTGKIDVVHVVPSGNPDYRYMEVGGKRILCIYRGANVADIFYTLAAGNEPIQKTYGSFDDISGKTIPIYMKGTVPESAMTTAVNTIIRGYNQGLSQPRKEVLIGKLDDIYVTTISGNKSYRYVKEGGRFVLYIREDVTLDMSNPAPPVDKDAAVDIRGLFIRIGYDLVTPESDALSAVVTDTRHVIARCSRVDDICRLA